MFKSESTEWSVRSPEYSIDVSITTMEMTDAVNVADGYELVKCDVYCIAYFKKYISGDK